MCARFGIRLLCGVMAVGLGAHSASALTIRLNPEGTGDYPTIAAAIEAANDHDIIELADGTYTGDGNRDIEYRGKSITVRSAGGVPERCIIDCESQGRGFFFQHDEGPDAVLEGITIRNGEAPDNGHNEFWGGGVACATTHDPGAIPTIRNCRFEANHASTGGGALYTSGDGGLTENCVFQSCVSAAGGAASIDDGHPTFRGCTIDACEAAVGSGFVVGQVGGSAALVLENCIVSRGVVGATVECAPGFSASLSCCDLWGNEGGDWVGYIADQLGQSGNFKLDPLYCGLDLTLDADSPCLPPQDSGCGLIGALGQGCDGLISVRPDGSGESVTIQDALDLAPDGGEIVLGNGTYVGPRNRNLDFGGKSVRLRSEALDPLLCVIDCQHLDRGMYFHQDEGPDAVVEGITIRNGEAPDNGHNEFWGGGVACATTHDPGAIPTIRNCRFEANHASTGGGALYTSGDGGLTENCVFQSCVSAAGGAASIDDGHPTFRGCTIDACEAAVGSGFVVGQVGGSAALVLENCIVSRGVVGATVECAPGFSASLSCCDLWGNEGGDWVGHIADQLGQNGNIRSDPLYCGASLYLDPGSPCAPANNTECGLIGAMPVCTPSVLVDVPPLQSGIQAVRLLANRPNPVISDTWLPFYLPAAAEVRLEVVDPSGRIVAVLLRGDRAAGSHSVRWDGRDRSGRPLASGVYFCRLHSTDNLNGSRAVQTRAIVLMR